MSETVKFKVCKRCNAEKPLNDDYWYKQRPRIGHPKGSWQSNCKLCWRDVNRENKQRRKSLKQSNVQNGFRLIQGHITAISKSEPVAE